MQMDVKNNIRKSMLKRILKMTLSISLILICSLFELLIGEIIKQYCISVKIKISGTLKKRIPEIKSKK